jgi:hypothetical protein
MFMEMSRCMVGWFAMVLVMGYFIWQELRENELEPEEEEPPSTRLAVPVAIVL